MEENLIVIGSFIFLVVFGYIMFDFIKDKPIKIKEKCTCGQEEKWCKSYLYSGGSTLLGRADRWKCGKFVKQFKELSESPAMQRIRKEIQEGGNTGKNLLKQLGLNIKLKKNNKVK